MAITSPQWHVHYYPLLVYYLHIDRLEFSLLNQANLWKNRERSLDRGKERSVEIAFVSLCCAAMVWPNASSAVLHELTSCQNVQVHFFSNHTRHQLDWDLACVPVCQLICEKKKCRKAGSFYSSRAKVFTALVAHSSCFSPTTNHQQTIVGRGLLFV